MEHWADRYEPDYRQQEELEEERQEMLLHVLSRCPAPEAAILAAELGLSNEWRTFNVERDHQQG